jgi:L-galactose dehydrogenase
MKFTTLGRTGLNVSIIGLGGGGPSRLGLAYGRSAESAGRLIRHALDRGVNIIDLNGAIYGTDEIVGYAIRECRHQIILSTKANLGPSVGMFEGHRTAARASARVGGLLSLVTSGHVIEARLNASLRRLKTDYIDLFSLHAVSPKQYDAAIDRVLPSLVRLRDKGKIRWIGITETFTRDPLHQMLARAAAAGVFDSIMIEFNILNPSGAPIATQGRKHGSGIIAMHAINRQLRDEQSLQGLLKKLVNCGALTPAEGDARRLMRALNIHGVRTLAEAALRFCRHELAADIILTGTGDFDHLDANIAACHATPLPEPLLGEFRRLFASLGTSESGA